MADSTTNVFQIKPFDNCDGCNLKVKLAVRKFDGVNLEATDPENGIFTISTNEHPEAIRAALQRKFSKKTIILLPKKKPRNSSVHQSRSCVASREGSVDFKGMTGMLMTLPQAERIQSLECRQDVLRVKYYERQSVISTAVAHIEEDMSGFVPPPRATKPSAPPVPLTTEDYAYGYPVSGSYARSTTPEDDDYPDCRCTIM
ncbi:hypothetical protein L2E82_32169 [Cichorium intybus]|uniref:Uncharacterized protein n=1 Tax=Cichorium intybus TaxID=13427 RepID=A0ACB9BGU7_CICIN|nr:hypothetical protein L2E82_32169 [Cichorium intybus]